MEPSVNQVAQLSPLVSWIHPVNHRWWGCWLFTSWSPRTGG